MDNGMYPFGPQKQPRLSSDTTVSSVVCRGNTPDESGETWTPTAIVPKFNVEKGSDVGKLNPEYWAMMEWNSDTGEYRLRALDEVVNWFEEP